MWLCIQKEMQRRGGDHECKEMRIFMGRMGTVAASGAAVTARLFDRKVTGGF